LGNKGFDGFDLVFGLLLGVCKLQLNPPFGGFAANAFGVSGSPIALRSDLGKANDKFLGRIGFRLRCSAFCVRGIGAVAGVTPDHKEGEKTEPPCMFHLRCPEDRPRPIFAQCTARFQYSNMAIRIRIASRQNALDWAQNSSKYPSLRV
jgi:hypothetical protein